MNIDTYLQYMINSLYLLPTNSENEVKYSMEGWKKSRKCFLSTAELGLPNQIHKLIRDDKSIRSKVG